MPLYGEILINHRVLKKVSTVLYHHHHCGLACRDERYRCSHVGRGACIIQWGNSLFAFSMQVKWITTLGLMIVFLLEETRFSGRSTLRCAGDGGDPVRSWREGCRPHGWSRPTWMEGKEEKKGNVRTEQIRCTKKASICHEKTCARFSTLRLSTSCPLVSAVRFDRFCAS